MAQAPQNPGGGANFIRQIVSDPKNVPDVTLLTGYLGASSEEGHERLSFSPDLSNYVEIPKAAILHQAPLPAEQDAHGGVTLWVKKDAVLQYKMAPAAQALANYFAGAIQAGAQGAAPAPRATPPQTMRDCTLAPALCAATAVGPGCQSFHVGTCIVQCNPTLFGPQCPFPTEVTCAPSVIGRSRRRAPLRQRPLAVRILRSGAAASPASPVNSQANRDKSRRPYGRRRSLWRLWAERRRELHRRRPMHGQSMPVSICNVHAGANVHP